MMLKILILLSSYGGLSIFLFAVLLFLTAVRLWSTHGKSRLPLALASIALLCGFIGQQGLPIATNNAALIGNSASIWILTGLPTFRLGVNKPGDAPISAWYGQSGTCSSHGVVSDVGYCNNDVTGTNSYVTPVGPDGLDWRQFGTGTAAANTSAINAASTESINLGLTGLSLPYQGSIQVQAGSTGVEGSPTAVLVNIPASGNFIISGNGNALSLVGADVSDYGNIFQFQSTASGNAWVGNASTVGLKDFVLGYASLPFAQATLTSKVACVTNANGSAVVQMLSGFAPAWANVERIDQYNNANGRFQTNILDNPSTTPTLTNDGAGAYTLTFNGTAACTGLSNMTDGDYYTLLNQQFGDECANFWHVQNVVLDDVKCISTAGNGFQFNGANDVVRKNGTGTYYGPGVRQTTNGGGFAGDAISGIVTTDTSVHFLGTGDDNDFTGPYQVNISVVASRTSQTLSDDPFIYQGDTLQYVDGNGVFQGTAVVASTTGGVNPTITLVGSGAPSGVANTWIIYDESQAPSLCQYNGGVYGETPTRGIFADCNIVQINSPQVRYANGPGIFVEYGAENVGLVPASVSISAPQLTDDNYGNLYPGSLSVLGWTPGGTGPATAGQIANVSIKDVDCVATASNCIYASAVNNLSIGGNSSQGWNVANTAPASAQTGCGNNTYAIALCSNSNIVVVTNAYLSTGNRIAAQTGGGITDTFAPGGFADAGAAFIGYTPTLSCASGTLTTATASGNYLPNGFITWVSIDAILTTVGSCSGNVSATLPKNAGADATLAGRETGSTGYMLQGTITSGNEFVTIYKYDNTALISNGYAYNVSGSYGTQ